MKAVSDKRLWRFMKNIMKNKRSGEKAEIKVMQAVNGQYKEKTARDRQFFPGFDSVFFYGVFYN